MAKSTLLIPVLSVVLLAGHATFAGYVTFIPPTDPIGKVWTTNLNDGYASGRGMCFVMAADVTIASVGIYHDLTDIDLYYELARTVTANEDVAAGQTVLRSGHSIVTTAGLQFVDFGIAPLTLKAGDSYHLEFTFAGNGNQNFFHTQLDNPTFNLGSFTQIDGTCGGNTANYVIPRMRVNTTWAATPAPGAILLGGVGTVLVACLRRRRTL